MPRLISQDEYNNAQKIFGQAGYKRYQNEYIFHQAVCSLGEWNNIPEITTSGGRGMRQVLDQQLASMGITMDTVSPEQLKQAMDTTFSTVLPQHKPMFSGNTQFDVFDRADSDFLKATFGISSLERPIADNRGSRLLVSPFDPRWALRDTVLRHGRDELVIKTYGVDSAEGVAVDQLAQVRNGFELYENKVETVVGDDGFEATQLKSAGVVYNHELDASGFSALSPYIKPADRSSLGMWMARGFEGKHARPEDVSRAVAVLDYLGGEGIDYTVSKDLREGQLKVRLDGTGIDVRLSDPDNPQYVGRVYAEGMRVNFTHPNPRAGATGNFAVTDISNQDTIDLIRFVRGERIMHPDGHVVGQGPRDGYSKDGTTGRFELREGKVIYKDATSRNNQGVYLASSDAAMKKLDEWVSSARNNAFEQLGVEELIELAQTGDDTPPSMVGDESLMGYRSEYWGILNGNGKLLLSPGVSSADYNKAYDEYEALKNDSSATAEDIDAKLAELSDMTIAAQLDDPVEQVRAHARLVVDHEIGTVEPNDKDGLRFNPVRVANLMDSVQGRWGNADMLVYAMRKADISADELRESTDGFDNSVFAEKLISFDEGAARNLLDHDDAMLRRIGQTVDTALRDAATTPQSIEIDDQGIIRWVARRNQPANVVRTRDGRDIDMAVLTGQIGQVFTQGERGEVVTNFAHGDNYMFFPGYEARLVDQKPGEQKTVEERLRLVGYEQMLHEAINYRVRDDVLGSRNEKGDPTSLNNVYRNVYGHRYDVDFFERTAEEGMTPEWQNAIAQTALGRVLYPKQLRDEAGLYPYRAMTQNENFDPTNDNYRNGLSRVGFRNMSIIDEEASAGIFDPSMTGTAKNHGFVRQLVEGAQVDPVTGEITPSVDVSDRAAMMKHPDTHAMVFDPHDRQNMTHSNLNQASAITPEAVNIAMRELNGFENEDGIPVSKEFAEKHKIRGKDGVMRALVPGDKLSDFHGNKGVISIVVDRNMEPEEANRLGIRHTVEFFKANPMLDVVLSPYSPISRLNAGTAREAMENPQDLYDYDEHGNLMRLDGEMGSVKMIITHMAVDAKTNIYDREAMAMGQGRKASSQLAWNLHAQGCDKVMHDLYGNNARGLSNVKERLMVLGMDITPTGNIIEGVADDHVDRKRFEMPELQYTTRGVLKTGAMANQFAQEIAKQGGMMELPFNLTTATGSSLHASVGKPGVFELPVMSSHLRNQQDLRDGSVSRHDFTRNYMNIFEKACKYRDLENEPDEVKRELEKRKLVKEAQTEYDVMAHEIDKRYVTGKHNMFKDDIMSNRMSHSATAVWSQNPTIDIDVVRMNEHMARELGAYGYGKNPYVLMFRDPQLRPEGLSYMRVEIDNSLSGIAINPAIAAKFDGDFDGDSVGLKGNLSPEAHAQALDKLTVEANLLDLRTGEKNVHGDIDYDLAVNTGLTLKVASNSGVLDIPDDDVYDIARGGEHQDVFTDIKNRVNDVRRDFEVGAISREEYLDVSKAYLDDLSQAVRDGYLSRKDRIGLSFKNPDAFMKSVEQLYTRGGKGSLSKLEQLAVYAGFEQDEAGLWHDVGRPLVTPEMNNGVQFALCAKDAYTGTAGKHSQHAMQAVRAPGVSTDKAITATLELSSSATQLLLGAKHSAEDAQKRVHVIADVMPHHWAGRALDITPDPATGVPNFAPLRTGNKYVQATPKHWVKQCGMMYEALGETKGKDTMETVARALTDPETGCMVTMHRSAWRDSLVLDGKMSYVDEKYKPMPLDRLAYDGTLGDLVGMAKQQLNMFSGKALDFAPNTIRKNIEAVYGDNGVSQVVALESITAKDTQADYTTHVRSKGEAVPASYDSSEFVLRDVDARLVEPIQTAKDVVAEPVAEPVTADDRTYSQTAYETGADHNDVDVAAQLKAVYQNSQNAQRVTHDDLSL